MTTRRAGAATSDWAHTEDNPAPEGGMSRDAVNLGLNIFKNGIKDYSEKERELLEWLWGYTFDELAGSKSALTAALGYDWTVLFKIFTGRYEAGLDRFCEAVANLRKRAEAGGSRFVSTVVAERMIEALDYAKDRQAMVSITGPTGRSKTFTAQWWAKHNNHGRARYLRIPSGCTRRTMVQLLCRSCGIGINGKKTADLEARLFKAFDFRNTIIIDEAGHLLPRCGTSVSAIEFVRDLHDLCGCGVALIFTNVYLEEFRHGRLAAYFEQYLGRIKFTVTIPLEVLRDEVAAVVRAFRKDPPEKLLALALKLARSRDGRLRTLFEDLTRAQDWAQKQTREMGYDDLKLASDWRLSGGIWPQE